MSTNVLTQLVEAEDLLSAQETALIKQLTEIQEQRKGLQTVIAMFDGSADTNGKAPETSDLAVTQDDDDEVETESETVKDTVAAKLAKVTKKAKITGDEAETTKAPKAKKASKSAKPAKTDGRTARWQRYVLDDYRQQRLQDVVADVLKSKSKDSFKITDVMSAIFEDDMPKAQFLKARSRISNILSAGARDNDWYRGRGGTYSISEKAVSTR